MFSLDILFVLSKPIIEVDTAYVSVDRTLPKVSRSKNMSKKSVPRTQKACPKDKIRVSRAKGRVSRKFYWFRRGLFYGVLGVSHNKMHFVYHKCVSCYFLHISSVKLIIMYKIVHTGTFSKKNLQ